MGPVTKRFHLVTKRVPWLVYLWVELEIDRGVLQIIRNKLCRGKVSGRGQNKKKFPAAKLGKPTTATKISTASRYDIGKQRVITARSRKVFSFHLYISLVCLWKSTVFRIHIIEYLNQQTNWEVFAGICSKLPQIILSFLSTLFYNKDSVIYFFKQITSIYNGSRSSRRIR